MNMFNAFNVFLTIPEDVIWEMSLDDEGGRNEYPEEDVTPKYVAPKRLMTCRNCGCGDLVWSKTENGFRLAYGKGKLKNKLHACDL